MHWAQWYCSIENSSEDDHERPPLCTVMSWSEWCSAEPLGLTSDLAGVDAAPENPMVRQGTLAPISAGKWHRLSLGVSWDTRSKDNGHTVHL